MNNVWNGLPVKDMAEIYSRIGPSLGRSLSAKVEPTINPSKLRGRVVKFNAMRNFGWIECKDGSELFVHIRDCIGASTLLRGQHVTYEVGEDRKGLPIAVKVEVIR